jgi:hypothetical protein
MKLPSTAERMAAGVERHYFRKSSGGRHAFCLRRVTTNLIVTGKPKLVTCRTCLLIMKMKKESRAASVGDPKVKFDYTKHRRVVIRLTDARQGQFDAVFVTVPQIRENTRRHGIVITMADAEQWCKKLRLGIRKAKQLAAKNRADGAVGRMIDGDYERTLKP